MKKKKDSQISSIITTTQKKHPELNKQDLEELLTKILTENISPKEAMGLEEEFLDFLYENSYQQYKNGQYQSSLEILTALNLVDPTESKYPICMAYCHHQLKNYEEAIEYYWQYLRFEPDDYNAFWNLHECYLEQGNTELAANMLGAIIGATHEDSKNTKIYDKAFGALEQLSIEAYQGENK